LLRVNDWVTCLAILGVLDTNEAKFHLFFEHGNTLNRVINGVRVQCLVSCRGKISLC